MVLVQLMHFSPDIFLAGKGLSAVDSATLKRANGPVRMAFHTCKMYSEKNVAMNESHGGAKLLSIYIKENKQP